ncbi:MAG: MoxR family ATPase [Microthrixaceae bacterium]|nr:MoxR family ATPase [Microthrixaceae bacterium]MCB1011503.1 MoxR family ATPase [Microthrixaceae bacterium]MCB9387794.1 MoxR family ATPase [Microthrixaceae bacterium]MCO5321785.1 MoxR family ATPase [Microthrixaceae bacterium]
MSNLPPEPPAYSPDPVPGGGRSPSAESDAALQAMLALRSEIAKVVVGQEGTVSGIITALLVRGHVLLEGVPGVAKTLVVKTLAQALDLGFGRVQFTPDLMPSDVTGQLVLAPEEHGGFRFREGPVFTNLFLADEINRTPPKTQAALLEAMEERQVTAEGRSRELPDPFIVIATENPVEQEGTYPLPEAQLDRFLFKLLVGYPGADQEVDILERHNAGLDPHDIAAAGVRPVASAADLAAARRNVAGVTVERPVLEYVVALCRATRESPSTELGVSPRGATALLHAAKAWAWLSGRWYVSPDEVKAVAKPALRHRLMVRPELELEGITADGLLDSVLSTVPAPR